MSALSTETLIPLSVLGASLAGSLHCASMCGGLVASVARTRVDHLAYHGGRLAGYLALGAIAGGLGEAALGGSFGRWASVAAALFLGAAFVMMGLRLWTGRGPHVDVLPRKLRDSILARAMRTPLGAGLATALLPCGWLHGFVLGAAATGSAARGGAFLFVFWLGTVPALMFSASAVRVALRPLLSRAPRVAAMLLIVAGALSAGAKLRPLLRESAPRAPAQQSLGAPDTEQVEHSHCH